MFFDNRKDAGIKLADALKKYKGEDVVVLALPRGGVVLGYEIAKSLGALLDLVITKKIGHPMDPEYAICAVAEEGEPVCNTREVARAGQEWLESATRDVRAEIKRRRKSYLGDKPMVEVKGRTVILVDDGIATGLTMIAAIEELRKHAPKKLIVAIPVTPADTARKLESLVDELVSLDIDENYLGYVGAYYNDFTQIEDDEVIRLLNKAGSYNE